MTILLLVVVLLFVICCLCFLMLLGVLRVISLVGLVHVLPQRVVEVKELDRDLDALVLRAKDCTPEIDTSEVVVDFEWHCPMVVQ